MVPSLPLVSNSLSTQQLATALQQVQQLQHDQLRMWEDFKQQANELQQLLADKQSLAADRDAAHAELGRVQELLQQQQQLQEAYAQQQQALLELQQRQQQQYVPMQSDQQACCDQTDCLDAFVVETQLVRGPVAVSGPVAVPQAWHHWKGVLMVHKPCELPA